MAFIWWFIGGVAALVLVTGFRVIRPMEVGLVERFGRYVRTQSQGLTYIIPFVDKMYRVNVTEQMADVGGQKIITKDDLNADVDAVVYYQVQDPVKAIYNVDHYREQIISLAQTTLRNIIGTLSLSDANTKRNLINKQLETELQPQTIEWGIRIVRVEMQRIEPPGDVQQAMNDVVTAERKKMAAKDFANAAEIEADGLRRAAVKKADGEREAQILRASGEATAIETINKQLSKSPKYIEWLRVSRWDGVLPKVTGGSIPMIDIELADKDE